MKPSLVILAAGMGSRYGGLKQIDGVGPNDEAIIEYSIYDALRAGFGKIIFVIRKDIEDAFKERFDAIKPADATFIYVYQEMDTATEGRPYEHRQKPWGTAHAVLAAQSAINEPFAVINADDYYGRKAYTLMARWLMSECEPSHFSMMGYRLANTLSEHGAVSRGVCVLNEDGFLARIDERTKVQWRDGQIIYLENDAAFTVDPESSVSMNFWGFHHSMFEALQASFLQFIDSHTDDPKSEFFIPLIVQELMDADEVKVSVIPCPDHWIGVTYREDKPIAQAAFAKMVEQGQYPSKLW